MAELTNPSVNTSTSRQTFHRAERLRSRKLIEQVAKEGKNVSGGYFRLKWLKATLDGNYPAQLAISVSKKRFKRSVDRNRIKRLIREVYRKKKYEIYETLQQQEMQVALLLMYSSDILPTYVEVENDLTIILKKLQSAVIRTA